MLILILLSALQSGCAQFPETDNCAGWKPVYMASETPAWLDNNDRPALAAIITHNEFGQSQGCW